MNGFSYKKLFNPDEIKKGSFITVKTGDELSNGIVLNVTQEVLTYTTYNAEKEELEQKEVTTDQLNDENVAIVFSTSLILTNEQNEKKEEKTASAGNTTSSKTEDFSRLINGVDMTQLIGFLQKQNPQIIAAIAMFLNQNKKSQLLYLLPDEIMIRVQEEMKKANLDYLNEDMMKRIQQFFEQTQTQEKQQESVQNPFDIFGELFKNKPTGNKGNMSDIFNEVTKNLEETLFNWLDNNNNDDDDKKH